MNVLILMGSPKINGNTAELCKPFIDEAQLLGAQVRYVPLVTLDIKPCQGCYSCQNVADSYGCAIYDDMTDVADDIMWADLIVLATPIFGWYCTAIMKNVIDRHYGFNKYYGSAQGCLWSGKRVALLLTHGYDTDYATSPFVDGMERLCKHSSLEYCGMYSVRDEDDLASFQTEEAQNGAREFARRLIAAE